jgi:hypothetical protein
MSTKYDQEWYELYQLEREGFFYDKCRLIATVNTFAEVKEQYNSLIRDCPTLNFIAFQCKRHRIYPNGDAPQEK